MDFRPAYAALAERLEVDLVRQAGLVRTVSRRNLPATSFEEAEQPAVLVLESSVDKVTDGNDPTPIAWRLGALLVVYLRVSGDDGASDETAAPPGDAVLQLVAALHGALEWHGGEPPAEDFGSATTLGGKCKGAWLEDQAEIGVDVKDASQMIVLLDVTMELDHAA